MSVLVKTVPAPTSQQLGDFHQMLDCVRRVGATLDWSDGELMRLKESVRQKITQNDADSPWASGLPNSYTESLAVFAASGDSGLALDRITLDSAVESELTRVARAAWIYLAWMILLAAGGFAVFVVFSLPAIESMRADMLLPPRHLTRIVPFGMRGYQATVIALVVVALALTLVSTTTHFPAWTASWFGGLRYRQTRLRAVRSLISKSLGEATPIDHKNTEVSDEIPVEYLQGRATDQLTRLRILVPIALIVLVGGSGVMLYSWLLFSPLIALIYDLSSTVTAGGGMK